MNFWTRSWTITKLSFDVIRRDPEMLAFPAIATLLSILYSIAMLFPTIVAQIIESDGSGQVEWGPLQYAATFLTYFGLAFIATFSNVCVVYTTKVRLAGGDATFGESIRFAMSRMGSIFGWSFIAASVGLFLSVLENTARNAKGIARVLLLILRAMLATAWTLMTLFVVPVMVYRDLGPIDALRESTATLRRTWGESLVRQFGMGVVAFVFYALGIAAYFAVGFGMSAGLPPALGAGLFALVTLYVVAVALVFGVANSVYSTALYHYASTGVVPSAFSEETISRAFVTGPS